MIQSWVRPSFHPREKPLGADRLDASSGDLLTGPPTTRRDQAVPGLLDHIRGSRSSLLSGGVCRLVQDVEGDPAWVLVRGHEAAGDL